MTRVFCIGGAAVDRKYRCRSPISLGTSNPVASEICFGGVARNVAENLSRLGVQTSLMSLLGDDDTGSVILRHLSEVGIDTHLCVISSTYKTPEYVAILEPNGDLVAGLADMAIMDAFSPDLLEGLFFELTSADWVFADCNLPEQTLAVLVASARRKSLRLAIDAVSAVKVTRLPQDLTGIGLLFLNLDEARILLGMDSALLGSPEESALALVERGPSHVILTCGAGGLIVAEQSTFERHAAADAKVVDVTGAGDALIAGTLAGIIHGRSLAAAVRFGMSAALLTIEHSGSARPDLSLTMVETHLKQFPNEPSHAIRSPTSLS
jgi:pseudouridine kinase